LKTQDIGGLVVRLFRRNSTQARGQSLVEMTLILPLLLMMLSGLVEFGFALNQYINLVEAGREGARYGTDGDPNEADHLANSLPDDDPAFNPAIWFKDANGRYPRCDGVDANSDGDFDDPGDLPPTRDYYEQVACVVLQAADPITLDPAKDDVVISVYRVYSDTVTNINYGVIDQWPDPADDPAPGDLPGQWRLYGNGSTRFNVARVESLIDPVAPSAGVLVVEVWYAYPHLLKLPWLTPFVGDPIHLYTYTIIPLPAAEPRPTPTPTPTPTNTFTPTPTNTFTPTPGNSPTPTDTATPTDTPTLAVAPTDTPTPPPCREDVVDADTSSLAVSAPAVAWADNFSINQIVLTLRNECGTALNMDGLTVNLLSSRGGPPTGDTLAFISNPPGTGQYFYQAISAVVGTSTYTAEVNDPTLGLVTIGQTADGDFVCVAGSWVPTIQPQILQYLFSNPSTPSMNRRLIYLRLEWPAGGGRQLNAINWGSASNTVWSGSATTSPLIIGSGDWTGSNRSIVTGTQKFLQLAFNYAVASTGTYRLITRWDDGNNGSVCETIVIPDATP
jgi:hypothetical protein